MSTAAVGNWRSAAVASHQMLHVALSSSPPRREASEVVAIGEGMTRKVQPAGPVCPTREGEAEGEGYG